jgi:AraC-like DNA-binding protein
MNSFPEQQSSIADLIARLAPQDGDHPTAIPGLSLHRRSAPTRAVRLDYKPSLAFVAQGAKSVMLGHQQFNYSSNEYLLTSIGLPVATRVTEASVQHPFLCFLLNLDMLQLNGLISEMSMPLRAAKPSACGIALGQVSAPLHDASVRLLQLLAQPQATQAITTLAPLIRKEIAYHLLAGPQGDRLRHMAVLDSRTHQIGRAMEWIKDNFALQLRIAELAERVNMSMSSLHHHFKAVTAMTPMQYQKLLRLEGARRMMLIDMLDAGAAGHRVGYHSASQFSREYARQYGLAPMRDIAQARLQLQRASLFACDGAGPGAV